MFVVVKGNGREYGCVFVCVIQPVSGMVLVVLFVCVCICVILTVDERGAVVCAVGDDELGASVLL